MSKAGAAAMRDVRHMFETAAAIEEKGVATAAFEAWQAEEEERIEKARSGILRLTRKLGLPDTEPFITDDFDASYPPHMRVCVAIEGIILNYVGPTKDAPARLSNIIGRCVNCGDAPMIQYVSDLSDLACAQLPHNQKSIATWLCHDCKAEKRAA